MTHDDPNPAELTDDELDTLLAAAHDDLLHRLQQHTDPTAGLLALMDDAPTTPDAPAPAPAQPGTGPAHHGRTVIELRDLARGYTPERTSEICHAMARAALPDTYTRCLVLALSLAIAVTAALDNLDVDLNLSIAFDLARDLDLNLARDVARARDLARNLGLNSTRDLVPDLARARDRALDLAFDLARDRAFKLVNRAANLDRALDVNRVRQLGEHLVAAVAEALASVPADVSGADLSGLQVTNTDVLAGVLWTQETIWPQDMRHLVEARSEEIRPGLYQVRGGTERDPHKQALV